MKLKKFMPCIPIAITLCAIGVFYFSGGFGASNFIPTVNDIDSVEINYVDRGFQNAIANKKTQMFDKLKTLAKFDLKIGFPIKYSDKNSILTVVRYHNDLLNEYLEHDMVETAMQYSKLFKESSDSDADSTRTIITYKLKDGSTVKRYYNYNGNEKTLKNLNHIQPYEHSVKEIEPRYQKYINQKDNDDTVHTLNIMPISSDISTNLYDITDHQLKLLTKAIAQDEKNASTKDLMNNSNGDVCILEILPHEDNEDKPYFNGVFKKSMDGYYVYIKPCYKNSIEFIENELQAGDVLKHQNGAEIKQLFIASYEGNAISYSDLYYIPYRTQYYTFDMKQSYSFDYNRCTRFYNMSSLEAEDKEYIDGEKTNSKAIDFLFSKAHVSADVSSNGVLIIAQSRIEKPYESDKAETVNSYLDFDDLNLDDYFYSKHLHSANGKIALYVTRDDYQQFLKMSAAS